MASKKPVRSKSTRSRIAEREEPRREEPREESRDSGKDSNSGGFVNITKLFETKKNPDNLVGTCKLEYLDDIADCIAEAKDKGLGVTFFVFLQGKWGPSLAATVSRPQEDRGSFNDGDRGRSGGQSRGRSNYGRNRRW